MMDWSVRRGAHVCIVHVQRARSLSPLRGMGVDSDSGSKSRKVCAARKVSQTPAPPTLQD